MKMLASPILIACTLTLSLSLAACGDEAAVEDLDMKAEDFSCILDWPKVDRFRISNQLGYQAEAEAVARSASGGTYPVGTVIQLIADEAMVKRRAGWNAATNDWEFFALEVSAEGTTIAARGTDDVVNGFGGNCLDCHDDAEPKWDMVCASGRGCEPLPFTAEEIEAYQQSDPRCP